MKKIFLLSVAATVIFAACQKENISEPQSTEGITLTASIEQQVDPSATKTALGSGNTVVWSTDDAVKVWSTSPSANTDYTLLSGAGTTSGVFSGTDITNPQYAFYPASAVTAVSGSSVTFTIPGTQYYTANSFGSGANIAVAKITGNSMSFLNVCGVLKLQLKGTTKVSSITVTGKADEKLNGTYTVNAADETPNMPCVTTTTDSEKSITLNCGGVLLDPTTAKNFYIVVPKGAFASGFDVTINDFFSAASEDIVASANTITRNTIKAMPEKSVSIEGVVLPGKFSVSATKKVRFASGNLRATLDADGDPTDWKFADHQYDVVGTSTIGTAAGDFDMFGFSTDGTGASSGYKQWGINTSQDNDDYRGQFVDWGTISDVVSQYGSGWHTLTIDEWIYLSDERSASTINGVSNARFVYVTVNSKRGVILFPDYFVWTEATMGTEPEAETINAIPSAWTNAYNYTIAQFDAIEQAGGVFVPTCGFRKANVISNDDVEAVLHSTSMLSSNNATYRMKFNLKAQRSSGDQLYTGHCVRLALQAD